MKNGRDVVIEDFVSSLPEKLQPAVEKSRFDAIESAMFFYRIALIATRYQHYG
jgi:hypothetical protein